MKTLIRIALFSTLASVLVAGAPSEAPALSASGETGAPVAGGRAGPDTDGKAGGNIGAATALAAPARAGGRHTATAPIVLAQADPATRVGQLEEQIRALNGRIEDLAFQMLQMQEQMRQMQEDNEYRFQALEGGAPADGGTGAPRPGSDEQGSAAPAGTPQQDAAAADLPGVEPGTTASTNPSAGAPPRDLGTVTFDADGNPVGAVPSGQTPPAGGTSAPAAQGPQTAALSSPEDIYQSAYNHVLAGDYELAKDGFRDYLDIHPDGPQAADASFWLGESEYALGNYTDAARVFLDAHQAHPGSPKAPEMLLKLGMSLAALDNRDTACATFREVTTRYPDTSEAVRQKVESEKSRVGC